MYLIMLNRSKDITFVLKPEYIPCTVCGATMEYKVTRGHYVCPECGATKAVDKREHTSESEADAIVAETYRYIERKPERLTLTMFGAWDGVDTRPIKRAIGGERDEE